MHKRLSQRSQGDLWIMNIVSDTMIDGGSSLMERGKTLLRELRQAGRGLLNGHRGNTGKVYLQLLETGVEKFGTTISGSSPSLAKDRPPIGMGESLSKSGQDTFVPERLFQGASNPELSSREKWTTTSEPWALYQIVYLETRVFATVDTPIVFKPVCGYCHRSRCCKHIAWFRPWQIGSEQMVYFMVSLDQSIMRGLSVQFCMQAPAPKPNVWTTIQLVRNLKRRLIEGTLPTIVGHRVLIVVDVTADVTLTTTSAPQSSDGG
ncbi:hypothetical protein EsDP_00006292 [Epichloe bromicola]|uniref:Transposase n=1 Tax=Epichloe bromicola TaxID=79588 RepID=A0ABQ0CX66_9HYPO